MPGLADIEAARKRLAGIVHRTPVTPSATFSERTGADVWLKLENLQRTGSFKIRGASNKIQTLAASERANGVVAASAGNHAQGVALGARLAGIPCAIVMPERASLAKAEAVRGYGADLLLHGRDYNEAEARALAIGAERGMSFVHAFNDPAVIAGQGTLGLEILEDVPDVDTVVVPVGGGGLISGIALAIKARRPDVRIVGVEPAGAAKLPESLKKGRVMSLDSVQTIADGLSTRRVGELCFEAIQRNVAQTVVVTDDDIALAILLLLERAKTMVEGAGAVGLAALLSGKIEVRRGEKVAVVLSGGNIDVTLLDQILQRGLAQTGRAMRLRTTLDDRPGALRDLLALIATLGANVESIEHDRTRRDVTLGKAVVELRLDTRGPEHTQQVLSALAERGYAVQQG
ncbi:MAG TPA: threonine ammonia-lyase [Candidatus Thermoplasmatota archaeon]|nr:threonine ammonia-lyase [Candidatus Thermoplasmatota archaeon]